MLKLKANSGLIRADYEQKPPLSVSGGVNQSILILAIAFSWSRLL